MRGSLALDAGDSINKSLHAGDIVVVTLSARHPGLGTIDRLARVLHSEGLLGLPLSALLS